MTRRASFASGALGAPSLLLLLAFVLTGCVATGDPGSARAHPRTEHDFFIGAIWPDGTVDDPYFLTYWDQVTPENGGKWANVEPERDVMRWADLDNAWRFAQMHDLPFRLHTLVWGQSHPLWLRSLAPEEQIAEMEEWFALLAGRYPGIEFIDVVNEPLHSEPFNADALGGWGESGYDWVITVFEMARRAFPDAVLQTNDYEILESRALTGGYVRLVSILAERGLIDAIGVQAHGLEDADPLTVRANLDALGETGLPIYITELDLAFRDDAMQEAKMRELVTMFAEHPAVAGITLWGYRRGAIFSRNAWLLSEIGEERAALRWLREYRATIDR